MEAVLDSECDDWLTMAKAKVFLSPSFLNQKSAETMSTGNPVHLLGWSHVAIDSMTKMELMNAMMV